MKLVRWITRIFSSKMQAVPWMIDVFDEDFGKIDLPSLNLLFEQSEKKFDSVSKVSYNITVRSYTFLAVIISFVSFFSSLVFGEPSLPKFEAWNHVLWIIPLVGSLILLILNILPHGMVHAGYEPKRIPYEGFFIKPKSPKDLIYHSLMISLMEDNQWKIDYTNEMNDKRLVRLQAAIILTSFSILTLLTMAVISS